MRALLVLVLAASPTWAASFGGQPAGPITINGAAFLGAYTNVQLRALTCTNLPCYAFSLNDFSMYAATGTGAGQWRNERLGVGP